MRSDNLFDLMMGAWKAQITFVLARLGVPDELAGGPRSASAVASAVGAHPDGMLRLLRAGATIGLMFEATPGCFGLTPLGECLRGDSPDSVREEALAYGTPTNWRLVGNLEQAIRTGRPAAPEVLGRSLWDHLAAHPEEAEHFSRFMGERSARVSADIAAAADLSSCSRIVDIGGAYGVLLTALLDRAPGAAGVLFDLPAVIEQAGRQPHDPRVETAAGDFFDQVPEGDLYVLKWILHDWDDQDAERILGNCRLAAAPGARLLVIEMIVPDPWQPSPVHLHDLAMLTFFGSRERTEAQYRDLLRTSGWRVERVQPTKGPYSLIQAVGQ